MDEPRYWILDSPNDSNRLSEVRDASRMSLVAIVDDEQGGIIAYATSAAADVIVDYLNND